MVKAVIFDYYGVLTTDRYMLWLHRHPEIRAKHAAAIEALSRAQDEGISEQEFFARLARIAGLPVETVREGIPVHGVAHEGLIEYVSELRGSGLKTAILSNAPVSLYDIVAARSLGHLFDVILCSGEVGVVKPHPKIFEVALGRLGLHPSEAIFVDDRDYNVRGAQQLGIPAVQYVGLAELRQELSDRGLSGQTRAVAIS
jgi:epoxide hydrolase-like predicted phosphatase